MAVKRNKQRSSPSRLRSCAVSLALLFFLLPAKGQELVNRIATDLDRPLYHAAQQLAEQTKTIITFEELIFEHADDLMEYQDRHGGTKSIPEWGNFDFEYSVELPVSEVLDSMLQKYQSEYPGKYKAIDSDGAFHIVPDSSKDLSGNQVPRSSLLDGEVSPTFSSNNAHDMACDVVKQATADTGQDVLCISDLARLSSVTLKNFSTEHREARDVLVDILKQSGGKRSWVILRSTTDGRYAISFIGQQNQ